MKKIRLLVVSPAEQQLQEATANQIDPKNLVVDYKQMIMITLRTPLNAQAGVSIEEMEKSLAILKKVDEVQPGDVLELEDADHEYLLQKLAVVRYVGFDERLVVFVHTLKNATQDILE